MRDVRVVFLGDSIVAGVGDPTSLGWVGRVIAGAFAAGTPMTSYNLGVRRDTSADILRRWQAEVCARIAANADHRVVFSFGANDVTIENGAQRVASTESVANLSEAIAGAAQLSLPVFVVGPAPVSDVEHNERLAELCSAFADVCKVGGAPYIDVFPRLLGAPIWMDQISSGDGAHPGAEGYSLLAEIVANELVAWLGETPAAAAHCDQPTLSGRLSSPP